MLVGGFLSTPRDFSSPPTTIRVVDQSGASIRGVEVSRNWYDSDCSTEGGDKTLTDQTGTSQFSKVPASVGLFTGVWRKAYSRFGMCGSGSGTRTTIYVRYRGRYDVVPQGKPVHAVGQSYRNPDGVWFLSSTDSQSNTLVALTFPPRTKTIDYVLSSSPRSE